MINAKTELCALIGDPVGHSLSPAIHNAAFQRCGLNLVYLAFCVKNVEQAIGGVRGLGIRGLSVTIPHKVAVMPFLDGLDSSAEHIGAVNTIVVDEKKQLIGYNTDGVGALKALEASGTKLQGARVLLIGSGGAARAIAFTLALQGNIASLTIAGVEMDQLERLATDVASRSNISIQGIRGDEAHYQAELAQTDILINASPLGMSPRVDATPVPSQLLHTGLTVFDIVYNPLKTRLLQEAEALGCKVVPGVEMFVQQAVAQFELWTRTSAPVELMRQVVLSSLQGV